MARADGIGPPPPAAARATLVVGARELAAERERAASSAKAPPPKMLLAVFVAALAVVGRGTLPPAFSVLKMLDEFCLARLFPRCISDALDTAFCAW